MYSKFEKTKSIGFMDSGIGGLNILRQAVKMLPKENFIYFGDNNNAPYGNRDVSTLKYLALKGLNKLLDNNVKVIVIACNTLSTQVLDYIKGISPVPIIPTLPIPLNDLSKYKCPTIICTPNTSISNYVKENFKSYNVVPLPFLAGEIERYIFSPNKISVNVDLKALPNNVDYLYLGCTHYLYIKNRIIDALNITVEDNLLSVCNSLVNFLEINSLKSRQGKANVEFIGECKNYNQKVFKNVLWT